MREPVNVESLERAIAIWSVALEVYKENMARIKSQHKLTWWARSSYWANEKMFHRSFTALIKRRIQLQTAISLNRLLKENSK